MSVFGDLKSIEKYKTNTSSSDLTGIPVFKFSDLRNKDEIGRGGFSTVFTAELPSSGEKIVVKKFFDDDIDTERKLFKEARLLNTLRHPNIVSLKGRCSDRYALLLEYVYFDLKPFGVNEIVNCLQALLQYFDKKNCAQIDSKVFYHAAKDIASGLQFLHENRISHRDLKPANILVSNQQYCHLSNPAEIEEVSSRIPLTCKLTDFGESRSQEIYTNTIISTKTKNINRGTPVYMAPEILAKGCRLTSASVEDLMKAGIWAYGLVVFSLINPGLKHPFEVNMMTSIGTYTPLQCLEKFFAEKKKPIGQVKYASKQKNDWKKLVEVYEACTEFDRFKRPEIKRVLDLLNANSTSQPIRLPRQKMPSCLKNSI